MRLFVVGLAAWVAVEVSGVMVTVRAHEPVKQVIPAEELAALKELAAVQRDWRQAQDSYLKALEKAKTAEERSQIGKEKRPKPEVFADRFLKLAERYPDSEEAIQALAWVIGNVRDSAAARQALPKLKEKLAALTDLDSLHKTLTKIHVRGLGDVAPVVVEKARKNLDHPQALPLLLWVGAQTLYGGSKELTKLYNETVDLVMDRFVKRNELAQLAGWLAIDDNPTCAEKHLRRLTEKNPSEVVKAEATFGLAGVLKNKDEASQPEAEKLFQSMVETKAPAYAHLMERAKGELDDMKLRGIGKPAPEILGADLDGKAFKLSDYKGKVVLLDFWGFW